MAPREVADARAWTALTIDAPSAWRYPLPAICASALAQLRARDEPITGLTIGDADRAEWAAALAPVHDALEAGRGFAIIEPAGKPLSAADAQRLYWIVGHGLGRPVFQNVQGTLLYDVRDMGQDLTKGARFSVTNYESSFHTDNSFGSAVVDYVGLLCLRTAKLGGRSQMVSGYAVRNELFAHDADALATLYEPFHVDRRGGVHAGETPTVEVPVMHVNGHELLVRYLRYWIEAGHEKVGRPLTADQRRALDVLDACLQRPELRVEFDLKPGDMYFINNRWILHNRTAFVDHAEPERRRHLVRLWLRN
jgi:Taurine catabolism dioxygenase TauD, TfdA family